MTRLTSSAAMGMKEQAHERNQECDRADGEAMDSLRRLLLAPEPADPNSREGRLWRQIHQIAGAS